MQVTEVKCDYFVFNQEEKWIFNYVTRILYIQFKYLNIQLHYPRKLDLRQK